MPEVAFPFSPHDPRPRSYPADHRRMTCDGCDRYCMYGVDYYNVRDEVWFDEAGLPVNHCMLCLACLATRLGRPLARADFGACPINHYIFEWFDGVQRELHFTWSARHQTPEARARKFIVLDYHHADGVLSK